MASKLTAEEVRLLIAGLSGNRTIREEKYLAALQLALQVLEAEPVADVVTWNHPSEERKCSVQLRRFDLKPGPLFMPAPQTTTDTHRQIENDGWIEWKGGDCPVDGNTRVQIQWNDGSIVTGTASSYGWTGLCFGRIVAYRVIENDGREG